MAAEQTVRIDGASPIPVNGSVSVTNPVSINGVVPTRLAAPLAGDVLAGGVQVDNSTTPTTIITIPAGRTWIGTVSVCASNADTTQSLATARVVTAGTGVVPAADTPIVWAISRRDSAATVNTHYPVSVIAPAGGSVTLQVVNSRSTTFSSTATATGVLV